ncbi:MAG: plastocyanin/azurin family copper-binding protein [Thermaerobacter sp.]|nr:plastocyanin/azurin family copper-binding protein [Thermaerobacter sp.]
MRNRKQLVTALVLLLVGGAGLLWLYSSTGEAAGLLGRGYPSGGLGGRAAPGDFLGNGGMMGGEGGYGGMMGGMLGGYGANGRNLLGNSQLTALVRRGEQGAKLDAKTDTVTYTGSSVTLVALASPHGKPNMTWEIDGLVNPTVRVNPGARVKVELVNTDWGYLHGFELTTTPPPYPFMAMMGINNDFLVMPLPPRTSKDLATAQYYTRSSSFTAASGTYYYICPVPGHAAAGMFGKLVVG